MFFSPRFQFLARNIESRLREKCKCALNSRRFSAKRSRQ